MMQVSCRRQQGMAFPFGVVAMLQTGDNSSGSRILVIEDQYFLAESIRAELESQEFEVVGPFGYLSTGLLDAMATPLHAAIVDINLHGWTTYEVLDRLRERSTPVVIATGSEPGEIPVRFAECCVVRKPYTTYMLLEAVRSVLPHH